MTSSIATAAFAGWMTFVTVVSLAALFLATRRGA